MSASATEAAAATTVPEGVPLTFDEELVAAVDFAKDADGLVPAIVQDATDGTVLTVAYMDAEALRRTLESGRTLVLQPQPPGVLAEGRDVGRPPVRPRGAHGLRRRRARGAGRPARARGVPHRRAHLLLPHHRHGPGGARAVTPAAHRARGPGALAFRPDPAEFAALAKEHAIVPVWCEVVADTLTPVACFANVVGRRGRVPLRVGRGRRALGPLLLRRPPPAATLTARGRTVEATGRLGLARSDDGILAAVEALVTRFQSPVAAGLPPLHGGLVGYLGYDVVREVERLPDLPRRRPRPSRRGAGRHRAVLRLRPLAPAHRARRQRGRARRARRRGRRRGGGRGLRGRLRPAGASWRRTAPGPVRAVAVPASWWRRRRPGSRRPRRRGP